MIEISNSMAQEIINVSEALRRMAFDKNSIREQNIKRRARLIVRYLTNKEPYGKKKRTPR